MLFCRAVSSLKTRWLLECINLLSTEDSLPSCSEEEEAGGGGEEGFGAGAGHALLSTCYYSSAQQRCSLSNWYFLQGTAPRGCPAPKEEGSEILLKYGCLINQEENSFTKTPIVHTDRTDRWLSPAPALPSLPLALSVRQASLFFEKRSSCICHPSSETRQKLSEPPIHGGSRLAPPLPFFYPSSRMKKKNQKTGDSFSLP